MTSTPDTSRCDQWIGRWADAKTYCVFVAFTDQFGPFQRGTPAWRNAVTAWIDFWVDHFGGKGIVPGRLTLLLVDETHTTVTAGKHMEAIREGVEDYETLRMLSDRVERLVASGVASGALAAAQKLLATAAERVTAVMDRATKINWHEEKDRPVADQVRIDVLDTLVRLSTAD